MEAFPVALHLGRAHRASLVVPSLRSRTKMSFTLPFTSPPGARFVAGEPNTTNRPLPEIAASRLPRRPGSRRRSGSLGSSSARSAPTREAGAPGPKLREARCETECERPTNLLRRGC